MLLTLLCALALHRIWIYEDIFNRPRAWLEKRRLGPIKKALLCPACFGFWAGLLACLLVWACPPAYSFLLYGLAAYLPVRVSVWVSRHASAIAIAVASGRPSRSPAVTEVVPQKRATGHCPDCEERARQNAASKPRSNVMLLRPEPDDDQDGWDLLAKALMGLGYRIAVAPGSPITPKHCGVLDAANGNYPEWIGAGRYAFRCSYQSRLGAVLLSPKNATSKNRQLVEHELLQLQAPSAKDV